MDIGNIPLSSHNKKKFVIVKPLQVIFWKFLCILVIEVFILKTSVEKYTVKMKEMRKLCQVDTRMGHFLFALLENQNEFPIIFQFSHKPRTHQKMNQSTMWSYIIPCERLPELKSEHIFFVFHSVVFKRNKAWVFGDQNSQNTSKLEEVPP